MQGKARRCDGFENKIVSGVVMDPLDYLVIAPHPDDAELGVGGTILLLRAAGARVGVLDLTDGEPTPFGSPEIRRRETDAATAVLGLSWRGNLGLTNRRLEADLDARTRLAGVLREVRPRCLFGPYWEDAHPDHVAASALTDAARFWAKLTRCDLPGEPHYPRHILYYFSVHLRIHPRPSFVLDISAHIDRKMEAIACYRSQFIEGRPTAPPTLLDDLRDRARYWGWAIGTAYGEPFLSREEIGLRGLGDLV
jgi:bacillithiol biosynthesis deacetylase BshB1